MLELDKQETGCLEYLLQKDDKSLVLVDIGDCILSSCRKTYKPWHEGFLIYSIVHELLKFL